MRIAAGEAVRMLVAGALALVTAACAGTQRPDPDSRFAAGWRPSRAYCAFGAETPRVAAWCAELNFGREGLLAVARDVNRQVLARAPGRGLPCTEHVAGARRLLSGYPDYATADLYSCEHRPVIVAGREVCHVSLLVTSVAGYRIVLDNGHVLEARTTGGVGWYGDFIARVDRHWLGDPNGMLAARARP